MQQTLSVLRAIVTWLGRALRYWVADIAKRKSASGKVLSILIGLFVVSIICGVPLIIVRNTTRTVGMAVGIIPTSTRTPTPTIPPTPTITPTASPTETPTVTPSSTPTLEPATQTVVAAKATAAAKAYAATATREAKVAAQQTARAIPTLTAEAIAAATATIVALDTSYAKVNILELAKAPDRFRGQQLKVIGEVFTISEGEGGLFGLGGTVTRMQIWVQVPGGSAFDREAVVVEFAGVLDGVVKGSTVIVYGKGAGAFEGTNTLGAKIRQPAINAEHVRY